MKNRKVYIKLIVFLAPVLIVWSFIEYKLSEIPNSYNQKKVFLEQQLDSIQVLVDGASHNYWGVDPSYFDLHGFNLANTDQSLFYDKRLTLKYIDKMPKLKLVVIEICYISFYYQINNNPIENWRDYFYSQIWDIKANNLPLWDMRRYSKIALYTPEKVKEYAKNNFKVNLVENLGYNGYYRIDTQVSGRNFLVTDTEARKRILIWNSLMDTTQYGYIFDDLRSFVSELRSRKIQVVFITTPVTPLISGLCDSKVIQKNDKSVGSLCRMYDCKYFNYFTDNSFTEREFGDVDHLNRIGAAHFSKLINEQIIKKVLHN